MSQHTYNLHHPLPKEYDDTQIKLELAKKANSDIVNQELAKKAKIRDSFNFTIPQLNWQGDNAPYTQAVNVAGMVEDGLPMLFLSSESASQKDDFNLITSFVTAAGSVIFKALEEKPAGDIDVRIEVLY